MWRTHALVPRARTPIHALDVGIIADTDRQMRVGCWTKRLGSLGPRQTNSAISFEAGVLRVEPSPTDTRTSQNALPALEPSSSRQGMLFERDPRTPPTAGRRRSHQPRKRPVAGRVPRCCQHCPGEWSRLEIDSQVSRRTGNSTRQRRTPCRDVYAAKPEQ